MEVTLCRSLWLVLPLVGLCGIQKAFSWSNSSQCGVNSKDGPITVSCQSCQLHSVPTNLPKDTYSLDLSHNEIDIIPDYAFMEVETISRLDLSFNHLSSIGMSSFGGLKQLRYLNLRQNSLCLGYEAYPVGAFTDLISLQRLELHNQSCEPHHTYPDQTFQDLVSLRELTLTGIEMEILGTGFEKLHSLEKLVMAGEKCSLGNISGNTFAALKHHNLSTLVIHDCDLIGGPSPWLQNFPNLRTLNLACNRLMGLNGVAKALEHIKSPFLDTLILDGISNYNQLVSFPRDQLCINTTRNVRRLTIRGNRIIVLDIRFLECFPNLEYLGAGSNPIYQLQPVRPFDIDKVVVETLNSIPIQTLDAANLQETYDSHRKRVCGHFVDDIYDKFIRRPPSTIIVPPDLNLSPYNFTGGDNPFLIEHLPPTLFYAYADNIKISLFLEKPLSKMRVNEGNNVLLINISSFHIRFLSRVEGLHQLQVLDASYCRIVYITDDALSDLPKLTHLYLQANRLGGKSRKFEMTFQGLKNLRYLDLSSNIITHIHHSAFKHASKLEYLDLSQNRLQDLDSDNGAFKLSSQLEYLNMSLNRLQDLNISFSTLPQLQYLDISGNKLTSIPDCMMVDLKKLSRKSPVKIWLSDNSLVCGCDHIPWMEWFIESSNNTEIVDVDSTTCLNERMNNETTPITQTTVLDMVAACQETTVYIIVGGSCALIVLIIISLIFIHRFRWSLRWHFYILRRKFRLMHQKDVPLDDLAGSNVVYHAFIAHNHDYDRSWVINEVLPKAEVEWGLKMCIGYRDFVAGIPITENVVNAVDNSRKVILVVTPNFAASEWCEFEMQMALTNKGMKHMIICYNEDIPCEDLSPTLRALIRNVNYIPLSNEEDGQQLFWQRLHDALLVREEQNEASIKVG